MTTLTRLLDVNVLLALTNPDHVHFARAQAWFAGVDGWATTPMTEAAFVRLMLNPALAGRHVPAVEVLDVLAKLVKVKGHVFWPDESSWLKPQIDMSVMVGHQQVTDFHLVDLAARHGGKLATFDRAVPKALAPADRRCVELI